MSEPDDGLLPPAPPEAPVPPQGGGRLQLLLDVAVFQIKLAMDGLRDILLVPISLIAGIVGVIRGGDEPDRPFREVLRFGRRTEMWINLFGYRRGETADRLFEPLQQRVVDGVNRNPHLKEAATRIGRGLDKVTQNPKDPPSS